MVGENENTIYLCKGGISPILLLKMMMEIGTIAVVLLDWMSLCCAFRENVWKHFSYDINHP
jgi:hypothetical protein